MLQCPFLAIGLRARDGTEDRLRSGEQADASTAGRRDVRRQRGGGICFGSRPGRRVSCATGRLGLWTVHTDARGAPLDYFLHVAGPAAEPTMYLGWALGALSMTVILLVTLLLTIAIGHRRRARINAAGDAGLAAGETGALRWVSIGTGVSSVLLIAALAYTLVVLDLVAAPRHILSTRCAAASPWT